MTTASTGPHQFSMDGWISRSPFEKLLNMTVLDSANGEATLTMPFLLEYANGAGIMHGGALVSLADTAVVMAIKSLLAAGSHFATIRLETSFLHPVRSGVLTAKAKVISRVDRIIEGRATVYDEADRAVMEFSSTFKIARDTRIQGVTFGAGTAPAPENPQDPEAK
jgi:acyl-CoA thioesterase